MQVLFVLLLSFWGFQRIKHPKTSVWMAWLIAWIMPLLCFVCIFLGLDGQNAREIGSLVAFHSIFCHLLLIAALVVSGYKMNLKQLLVGFPLALVLYEGVYRLILYWLFP